MSDSASSVSIGSLSPDCLLDSSSSVFLIQVVIAALSPLAVVAMISVVYLVVNKVKHHRFSLAGAFGPMIIVLMLIHAMLAKHALYLFRCVEAGRDTDGSAMEILLMDASVRCYSSQHIKWLLSVGTPMLLLYVTGIPLFIFYNLRKHNCQETIARLRSPASDRDSDGDQARSQLTDMDRELIRHFSFLFKGYKIFFWDFVVLLRKVLILAISVFFSGRILMQTSLVMMILTASISLHCVVWPFQSELLNRQELGSIMTVCFTMICGVILREPQADRTLITVLIMAAVLCFLSVSIALIVFYWYNVKGKHKLQQLKTKSIEMMSAVPCATSIHIQPPPLCAFR